jgi:hypothetical protein
MHDSNVQQQNDIHAHLSMDNLHLHNKSRLRISPLTLPSACVLLPTCFQGDTELMAQVRDMTTQSLEQGPRGGGTVLTEQELHEFLVHITHGVSALGGQGSVAQERFAVEPSDLICGEFEHAAKGFYRMLNVPEKEVFRRAMAGVKAIQEEVKALGDRHVMEQLEYILHQPTSEKVFPNGIRDRGNAGLHLRDFVQHEHAKIAELEEAEVVSLRLYTTSAFQQINNPLRDQARISRGEAHPLPVTVMMIVSGIKKLRAVNSRSAEATQGMVLWRGLKNIRPTDFFVQKGGTEVMRLICWRQNFVWTVRVRASTR